MRAEPYALALCALGLCAAPACGVSSRETYQATGVVEAVDPAQRQVKIAHDAIPGFMPAMTMNFDVASPDLLANVEPGMRVGFELERDATQLRVTALEVMGGGDGRSVDVALGPEQVDEPAPDFRLVDQSGRTLALRDLRGRAVLLDFVFTRCPGPCPILTSTHVALQRQLPPELAARTHFVSISLDPAWDTPERLREYGAQRGVRFERWSFLTGEPDEVQAVLDAYHIGRMRQPDGTLDHLVVTFLIDPEGRIARRYLGLEHDPKEILADLEELT